jgi:uncharacterized protein
MRILITGGTGTIGDRLVDHLISHGHALTIVSRQAYKPAHLPAKLTFIQWDGQTAAGWGRHLAEADAVVHLAAANLADAPWTDKRKKIIRASRVDSGRAVVEAFEAAEKKPAVLIQASAVGYYGVHDDERELTEESDPGSDFLAGICREWEASTEPVEKLGVRRVIIRTGVVFDPQGGALPKMMMPFRFFVGGPVGSGSQWMSWIHHLDTVNAIRFLIENEAARGPFNLTAPNPVRNREFAKAVGKQLKRPSLIPAPAFVLERMYGEMATVVLEGQRVIPKRLQELGYPFKFPDLDAALLSLVKEAYGAD